MISAALRKMYPLTFWSVRLSIYDGQVNCLVKELIVRQQGRDFRSPDNVVITTGLIMKVQYQAGHPELERSMICDDESRLDECVQLLHQSLREDSGVRLERAKVIDTIAHLETVVMKRRPFVE